MSIADLPILPMKMSPVRVFVAGCILSSCIVLSNTASYPGELALNPESEPMHLEKGHLSGIVREYSDCFGLSPEYHGEDKLCILPFIYRGIIHEKCTFEDDRHPWCATGTDHNGHLVGTAWGYCTRGCPLEENRPCFTVSGGPVVGGFCRFPFRYKDVEYQACTDTDHRVAPDAGIEPGTTGWCATKVDAHNNYIPHHWGVCEPKCKPPKRFNDTIPAIPPSPVSNALDGNFSVGSVEPGITTAADLEQSTELSPEIESFGDDFGRALGNTSDAGTKASTGIPAFVTTREPAVSEAITTVGSATSRADEATSTLAAQWGEMQTLELISTTVAATTIAGVEDVAEIDSTTTRVVTSVVLEFASTVADAESVEQGSTTTAPTTSSVAGAASTAIEAVGTEALLTSTTIAEAASTTPPPLVKTSTSETMEAMTVPPIAEVTTSTIVETITTTTAVPEAATTAMGTVATQAPVTPATTTALAEEDTSVNAATTTLPPLVETAATVTMAAMAVPTNNAAVTMSALTEATTTSVSGTAASAMGTVATLAPVTTASTTTPGEVDTTEKAATTTPPPPGESSASPTMAAMTVPTKAEVATSTIMEATTTTTSDGEAATTAMGTVATQAPVTPVITTTPAEEDTSVNAATTTLPPATTVTMAAMTVPTDAGVTTSAVTEATTTASLPDGTTTQEIETSTSDEVVVCVSEGPTCTVMCSDHDSACLDTCSVVSGNSTCKAECFLSQPNAKCVDACVEPPDECRSLPTQHIRSGDIPSTEGEAVYIPRKFIDPVLAIIRNAGIPVSRVV